jgi:hypothetical protein
MLIFLSVREKPRYCSVFAFATASSIEPTM